MTQVHPVNRVARHPVAAYLADICKTERLTAEEERALAERLAEGDRQARERMITANLHLVVSIARRYQRRGLVLSDLIGEGNLGLLRAVDHFDPRRGIRFSTYATYWIEQSVKRSLLNAGRSIRLPAYLITLMTRWRQMQRRLRDRLGREPTVDELAAALKVRPRRLERLKEALAVCTQDAVNQEGGPLSLDHHLADTRGEPESEAIEEETRDQLRRLLEGLKDSEALVIRLRFGLDDDRPRTLKEIGDQMGLTRERVRQIESSVLRRLGNRLAPRH